MKVTVWDGRYLVNKPDCIIIKFEDCNPIYVTAETWNKYTGNYQIKSSAAGKVLTLTTELYNAFKKASIAKPANSNSTIPNDLPDNICERCGGLGIIEAYKHINNGICFECNGTGIKNA